MLVRALLGAVVLIAALCLPTTASAAVTTVSCTGTSPLLLQTVVGAGCQTAKLSCPAERTCRYRAQVTARADRAVDATVVSGARVAGGVHLQVLGAGPAVQERNGCQGLPTCSRSTGTYTVTSPPRGATWAGSAACTAFSGSATTVIVGGATVCTVTQEIL